jgi:hypothetical protein
MDVADQYRRIVERLDGEAEVVLLVRAPSGTASQDSGRVIRRHPCDA